jgi:magnesium transporter
MLRILATRGNTTLPNPIATDLPALLNDPEVCLWVDLAGPSDETAERILNEVFHFHPLAVEDCLAERERPKLAAFDGYIYSITHGIGRGSDAEDHEVVELDAFLGARYLVTYHAKESRSVDAVFTLAGQSIEAHRWSPASLLQAVLDRQVDGIEPLLDDFERRLESLEERVLARPMKEDLASLAAFRRNLIHLRRWLGLQRDVVLRLSRNEANFFSAQDAILFRDTHDHLARCTEFLETYRDITNTIQEAALSVINNRLGENMKFLTLFSAVLMPLSLLAGIYGMNFQRMPGLDSPYGFPLILSAMAAAAGGVLLFFHRKGWLGQGSRPPVDLAKPGDQPKV